MAHLIYKNNEWIMTVRSLSQAIDYINDDKEYCQDGATYYVLTPKAGTVYEA